MIVQKTVMKGIPWHIQETTKVYELTIEEGAEIIAPEGKFLTLTVDGCGRELVPGHYMGDVVVSVTDPYMLPPQGLHKNFAMLASQGKPLGPELNRPMKQAAVIKDGKVEPNYSIPAIMQRTEVADGQTDGLYMASSEEDFCGVLVTGEGEYTIQNSRFDLEGNGHDDWFGNGTAVLATDDAKVVVDNCQFNYSGVTRCLVQAGGNSSLVVKNSDLINIAPDGEEWVGDFSWAVGFRGHNRIAQLCDNADVRYENCRIHGNGWGLLSIDGSGDGRVREGDPEWPADCDNPGYGVTMYIKDSDLTLTGPRQHGYGAFCIGDNHVTFDHSNVDVFGYPMFVMGMEGKGKADIVNGSKLTGRRFGVFVVDDDNSLITIADSTLDTDKSNICIKGSATEIQVKNSTLKAGNGTILQMMDSDEGGMNKVDFKIPFGVKDEKDETRDLTKASLDDSVVMTLTDCDLTGDFYNSTTNIRALDRCTPGGLGRLHDAVLGVLPFHPMSDGPSPVAMRHNGNDFKGALNLGINLVSTSVTGVISSATQEYRDGLAVITSENCDELSNVTQTAAMPVNNGVVVTLDKDSAWHVTGQSYVTSLTIAEGAVVDAVEGKTLKVLVNGVETELKAGTYEGVIALSAE